jgi:CHAD domain-containing protein
MVLSITPITRRQKSKPTTENYKWRFSQNTQNNDMQSYLQCWLAKEAVKLATNWWRYDPIPTTNITRQCKIHRGLVPTTENEKWRFSRNEQYNNFHSYLQCWLAKEAVKLATNWWRYDPIPTTNIRRQHKIHRGAVPTTENEKERFSRNEQYNNIHSYLQC